MKSLLSFTRAKMPVALVVSALFGFAFFAQAQRPPEGSPDRPRRPEQPREERQQPAVRPIPPVESILTEDQRATFHEAMEASREDMQRTEEKMRQARRALEDAIYADKLDEKDIREKAAVLSELEAERALTRARIFSKVRPSLTAEQLAQWRRNMQMRADAGGRFVPPRGDGRPQRPEGFREPADRPAERPRDEFRDEPRRRPEARPVEPRDRRPDDFPRDEPRRFRDEPASPPRAREFRPERPFDGPPPASPRRAPAPGDQNFEALPPAGR